MVVRRRAPAFPIQVFGFGARLCPGRFFARMSIGASITGILATFEIAPTEDAPPEKVFTSGIISYVVLELLPREIDDGLQRVD